MIWRITGIILGVVAFLLVYWLSGLGTPSQPNLALALLGRPGRGADLAVGHGDPHRQAPQGKARTPTMQAEVAKQVAEQTKSNPS